MSPELSKYLSDCYRRDVLGENLEVEDPPRTGMLTLEIAAEIARIDGMGLGANLAQRAFADHQHRKAMMALIDRFNAGDDHAARIRQ
jgi:hypothetical protein